MKPMKYILVGTKVFILLFLVSCAPHKVNKSRTPPNDGSPGSEDSNPDPDNPKGGISSSGIFGIGIDWQHQIYLQEYWNSNTPFYAIYNYRHQDIELRVNAWRINVKDQVEVFKKFDHRFRLQKHGLEHFDISFIFEDLDCRLPNPCYLNLQLEDGTSIGSIYPPSQPSINTDDIVTVGRLNLGGGLDADFLWYEQQQLTFRENLEVEIKLMVPSNSGTIEYFRKTIVERAKEQGSDTSNYSLPEMLVIDASSTTLDVKKTDKSFFIETENSTSDNGMNEVLLKFEAQSIDHEMLVMFDGWRCNKYSDGSRQHCSVGAHINRGVIVAK